MPIVLTSCTNRKRVAPSRDLTASRIPKDDLRAVSRGWAKRLKGVPPAAMAADLYCGRAFRQAQAASSRARAELLVVSAGLGLIKASNRVPSYSLTVTPGSDDNILSRIAGGAHPSEWWAEIGSVSPLAIDMGQMIRNARGAVLIALSAGYLDMIADDLLALPARTRAKLRIFTLTPASMLHEGLRTYVLPYDKRFDGPDSPIPGTRGDFAQRALGHFVETVLNRIQGGDFDAHADAVERMLTGLRQGEMPTRAKLSDPEITSLIHRHWKDASGQSGRMLRYLRDDLGVACEQSRFRDLFIAAKAARSGTQ